MSNKKQYRNNSSYLPVIAMLLGLPYIVYGIVRFNNWMTILFKGGHKIDEIEAILFFCVAVIPLVIGVAMLVLALMFKRIDRHAWVRWFYVVGTFYAIFLLFWFVRIWWYQVVPPK